MFERNEFEKEVVIVQKPYHLYLLLGAFVSSVASNNYAEIELLKTISFVFWLILGVFFVINLKSVIQTRREISRSMKVGGVIVSGSRFSIKNPVTYRITK